MSSPNSHAWISIIYIRLPLGYSLRGVLIVIKLNLIHQQKFLCMSQAGTVLDCRKQVIKSFFCCCCPVAKSGPTLCNPMDCSTPGFSVLHCLPELAQTQLMSIELMMLSNHLILYHPLLLFPSNFPSFKVFFSELPFLHQVAKVLELQLQHQSFQ